MGLAGKVKCLKPIFATLLISRIEPSISPVARVAAGEIISMCGPYVPFQRRNSLNIAKSICPFTKFHSAG